MVPRCFRTVVVIPAFNEEERLGATVRAAGSLPGVESVWVIDDGSRDGTAQVARRAGARVLALPVNGGKGAALNQGLWEATAGGVNWPDAVVFLDADLGESASAAEALLHPLWRGEADMVIAALEGDGTSRGFGLVRRLAGRALWAATGMRFHSPLSGQRALNRRALQAVIPLAPGWGVEVAMTLDACRAGLRLREVPVALRHRVTARDVAGFQHRARQLWGVLTALAGVRQSWPPLQAAAWAREGENEG